MGNVTYPLHTNRVDSKAVQSYSQRRASDWLKMAAAAKREHQQSRVESHQFSSGKFLGPACSIFGSQSPVIWCDVCYLEGEMDVKKCTILVKDHEAIYCASRCGHRNRVLH